MQEPDGMNEGQGAGVGKVERAWRREIAPNTGAVCACLRNVQIF